MTDIRLHDVVETVSRPGVECRVVILPHGRDLRYGLDVPSTVGRRPSTIFAQRVRLVRTWELEEARTRLDLSLRYKREGRDVPTILRQLGAVDEYLDAARERGQDTADDIRGVHLIVADLRHHLSRLEL